MSSIRRLLKAHARRLVLISFVALGLLVAFYALAGLARGLGKRAAVYQLLMPNSFYSLIAFINVLFIAVAQPLPSSLEQIRLRQKEDWLKTVIGWLLLSSLWTSVLSAAVLEGFLLAEPAISQIYWLPLVLTVAVAFENLLFFQSLILLIYLLVPMLNYLFVNGLVYALVVLLTTTLIRNKILSALINSDFLLQGDVRRLILQTLVMWGLMLVFWGLSSRQFSRGERL